MHVDYISLALVASVIVFASIMFIVIWKRSRKSKHPDAQLSNASNPTLLQHAPPESQSAYSASMLSLSLEKTGSPEDLEEKERLEEEGKRFNKRLFYEDTGEDRSGWLGWRATQVV